MEVYYTLYITYILFLEVAASICLRWAIIIGQYAKVRELNTELFCFLRCSCRFGPMGLADGSANVIQLIPQ